MHFMDSLTVHNTVALDFRSFNSLTWKYAAFNYEIRYQFFDMFDIFTM